MAGQYRLDFNLAGGTGGATTFYIAAPYDLTIKGAQAACSADPGDGETITFGEASTDVGVLTYGTDIAAGAVGVYAADSTNGKHKFDKGDAIKVVISQLTAAATFCGYIDVDPYCAV
jgi:hypothetical protein